MTSRNQTQPDEIGPAGVTDLPRLGSRGAVPHRAVDQAKKAVTPLSPPSAPVTTAGPLSSCTPGREQPRAGVFPPPPLMVGGGGDSPAHTGSAVRAAQSITGPAGTPGGGPISAPYRITPERKAEIIESMLRWLMMSLLATAAVGAMAATATVRVQSEERIASPQFFSTTLGAVVPEKMVDFLMRHQGRVEHRYFDPGLAEQAAAVALLPRLWPAAGPEPHGYRQPENGPAGGNLTTGGPFAEDVRGTPVGSHLKPISTARPGPANGPPECQRSAVPAGPGRQVESLLRAAGQGRPEDRGSVQSSRVMQPEIGISGLITAADPNDLADLFEALARLLRTRSSGHDGRSEASSRVP